MMKERAPRSVQQRRAVHVVEEQQHRAARRRHQRVESRRGARQTPLQHLRRLWRCRKIVSTAFLMRVSIRIARVRRSMTSFTLGKSTS